ncbi:MAG: ABC transporter substrate-binding protein [Candidatus Rokubacteria bacterium]|nr:ABC transporter substrate-binding protein [Candidatus Rokubacteria bacterium]
MKLPSLLLTVITMLVLASPAVAQKVPGVTDTEIVVGLTTPLSGPAAAWGNTAVAMEAWARHVNDQGGINGRKLKVVMKDDGYNPGRAVANLKEMKDSIFMNVGLLGSAILQAAKDDIAEYKLPVINPYGNPAIWARQPREKLRYVFVAYTDYLDEGEYLLRHAVEKLGAKKVAVFHQNDEYGKGGLEGVNRGVKALGGKVTLAGAVSYELSDRELGTHALKLKDSGADVVILYPTITHGANVIKEMAKAGYRPKLVASFPLGDYLIMYRLLGELWEGAHFNILSGGAIANDPAGKAALDIVLKYEPKLKGKENTALAGVAPMILAVEGLKKAGRNLTRESYVEAMESIKNFTAMGLSPAGITFGPNRRHGLNAVRTLRAVKAADNSYAEVAPAQVFPPHF